MSCGILSMDSENSFWDLSSFVSPHPDDLWDVNCRCEGIWKSYEEQHNKPLPQETTDKIMLLYSHWIEHCCREAGLTVEEEEQWDAKEASINENQLSNSGEESKEHDSDDVNFYTDSEEDNEDEERELKKMISKRSMMRMDKWLNLTGMTIQTDMFMPLRH
jgi:hypothetical protein